MPMEPPPRRQRQRPALRWHENRTHLVCRRQNRLPHAAYPLPDLPSVSPIQRFDEHFVLDLLVDDGQARGLVAMNMMEGTLVQIRANAVVLATGGAGRVYRYNTNGGIVTGDGMGMALGHGVRCATWNSFSITRPACRAPGS